MRSVKKKICIFLMIIFIVILFISVGVVTYYLESHMKIFLIVVSFPFLFFVLNVFWRRNKYIRQNFEKVPISSNHSHYQNKIVMLKEKNNKRALIYYQGNKYEFSISSFYRLLIGSLFYVLIIYIFFDLRENQWLEELVTKQAVYLTNLLFDLNISVSSNDFWKDPWYIVISSGFPIVRIVTLCTAIQVHGIIGGIIVFTPIPRLISNKEEIIWRKTKIFLITLGSTYVFNLFRIVAANLMFYNGISGDLSVTIPDFFTSLVIVFLTLYIFYKRLPEFYLILYYALIFFSRKKKSKLFE